MDGIKSEIYNKIKVSRSNRYLTNCYSMDVIDSSRKIYSEGDEFIFSYEDHGIYRIVFFVKNWKTLDGLMENLDPGRYYLEIVTRNLGEYIPQHSEVRATMMRMANVDCNSVFEHDSEVVQFMGNTSVSVAEESDAEEINKILWTTFHTEVSHLLTDDEVVEKIRIGEFTVHKDAITGKIDALLQAEVMPKKFYINQIVNKTEPYVVHGLLLSKLKEYVDLGGKYLYAWVEDKNIASLKFHEKYGMRHDGMYSVIYDIER